MKVRCINNELGYFNDLTEGKVYEAEIGSPTHYLITDNAHEEWEYKKSLFEIVNDDNQKETNHNQDNQTYTTLEMAQILIENPTYKAEYCIEPNCSQFVVVGSFSQLDTLIYEDNRQTLEIKVDDKRRWRIIKPIIKVKFAEAYKYFKNNKKTEIESCVTGNAWYYANRLFDEVTDEEIDGYWIVRFID